MEEYMKTAFSILVVILSTVFSGYALGEEKTYLVGAEDTSYYPHYAVKDKEYVGFAREAVDAFAKKYGFKFVYNPLPVMRLHRDFIGKKLDFLYPNNPEWLTELKEKVTIYYSNALVNVTDGVMALPENRGRGLAQLKHVVTIHGFTLPPYEGLIKDGKIKISESYEFKGLLESVMRKHADGAYITVDCANHYLRTVLKKPNAVVFDPELPYDVAAHMLSTITHPDIIEKFNIFLNEDKQVIEDLKDKYKID
jgi:hypothetical protein